MYSCLELSMPHILEREREIRELIQPVRTEQLHVAPYFRVMKSITELKAEGLPVYRDRLLPKEIRERMWRDARVDCNGMFTFPPGQLILGHTTENVNIPRNEQWRMNPYFIDDQTRRILPILTNITAPTLKRGSRGPQTYEIRNESDRDITIEIARLVCLTEVVSVDGDETEVVPSEKFGVQEEGIISLGSDDYEIEIIRRRLNEQQRR